MRRALGLIFALLATAAHADGLIPQNSVVAGPTGGGQGFPRARSLVAADVPNLGSSKITGTATNDNATAGNIGEFVSSNIVSGSAVSLVNATAKDITTISLTAGDWDVQGMCATQPAGGTTTSAFICSISPTLNTLNTTVSDSSGFGINNAAQAAGGAESITTDTARVSLAATTTYHLVTQASFAVSTMAAYGKIRARRVR